MRERSKERRKKKISKEKGKRSIKKTEKGGRV